VERSTKHFINRDLLAPNVLEVDIDPELPAALAPVIRQLQNSDVGEGLVDIGEGIQLHAQRPQWQSDILWVSQRDRAGYDYFEVIFNALGIAQAVSDRIAHDSRIVMYSGFFVTRRACSEADLHCDWLGGNNDAFTLIAPLTENCGELGLAYRTLRNEVAHYDYRLGKGLIFGDHFLHSTAPGEASGTTVLLSITFGTDRMDNWANIARSAAKQGIFHCQPDGQFIANG
jgi:hypothetical protein